MRTMQLIPGTPEWHAHRAQHRNASDAPAMLGCSPYTTRAELMRRMHTGLQQEVGAGTQRLFDNGHRFEALARPLAEEIIGDDLAPVIGVLEGTKLSASFDGLTLMGDTAWEHKTLNADLRACMKDQGNGYGLPKHYQVQMEQQLIVSGAERVLFMASEWTGDGVLVEERHCWYASDPALRAEILAGWKQFDADLAAYEPPAPAAPVTAAPIESLPAVQVTMGGTLTVTSNLDAFGLALRGFIERIPAQPTTDQDFADTEAACKALKKAEEALEAEEARALAGMADVEKMRRIVADLANLARSTRLQREKLVKARKDQLRTEQVQRGRAALASHLQGLNRALGGGYMPDVAADFAGVISGKKTMQSIADAIDTELARAKIAANDAFLSIQDNLNTLREHGEHRHLFPDVAAIVQKKPDDLQALVALRIADHKAAEEKRLEAERARIRAEEEARARAQAAREQQEREAAERRQREEAEALQRRQEQEPAARAEEQRRQVAAAEADAAREARPGTPAPAATVVPMPARAPAAPAPRILTLGAISQRLGFTLSASFVCDTLGVAGERVKAATMFSEPEFDEICSRLSRRIESVRVQHQQRAA